MKKNIWPGLLFGLIAFGVSILWEASANASDVQSASRELTPQAVRDMIKAANGEDSRSVASFQKTYRRALHVLRSDRSDAEKRSKIEALLSRSNASLLDLPLAVGDGAISGTVTESVNGFVITNIQVDVYNGDDDFVAEATTGTDGFYIVNDLPPDTYKVEFWDFENQVYLAEWYNDKADIGAADPVAVAALSTTGGIDAVLEIGGAISGRVTANGTFGIAAVGVTVFSDGGGYSGYSLTGADGSYTVGALPDGNYRVEFDGADVGYFDEWYDDQSDFATADDISVTVPDTTSGIDAVLDAIPSKGIFFPVKSKTGKVVIIYLE